MQKNQFFLSFFKLASIYRYKEKKKTHTIMKELFKTIINNISNCWLFRELRLGWNVFYVNMLITMYESIYKK